LRCFDEILIEDMLAGSFSKYKEFIKAKI